MARTLWVVGDMDDLEQKLRPYDLRPKPWVPDAAGPVLVLKDSAPPDSARAAEARAAETGSCVLRAAGTWPSVYRALSAKKVLMADTRRCQAQPVDAQTAAWRLRAMHVVEELRRTMPPGAHGLTVTLTVATVSIEWK